MRAIPPITSKSPIGRASSAGSPTLAKKPPVPAMSKSLGKPCAIKEIPASILMEEDRSLLKFDKSS